MRGFYLLAPRAAKAEKFWCYSLFHDSPEFSNVVIGSHYRKKLFFRLNGLQNRFEALKAEFHREPKSGQVCGTGCPACPSTDMVWVRKRQGCCVYNRSGLLPLFRLLEGVRFRHVASNSDWAHDPFVCDWEIGAAAVGVYFKGRGAIVSWIFCGGGLTIRGLI